MYHITLIISLVSFAIGMGAFFLSWYLYLLYRSRTLKVYIIFQIFSVLCVLLNIFYEYIMLNRKDSDILLILWYSAVFVWTPFFFYSAIRFVFEITQIKLTRVKKWTLIIVSALLGLPVLFPYIGQKSLAVILSQLEWEHYMIAFPACLSTGIISLIVMVLRYRMIEDKLVRKVMKYNSILNATLVPALFILLLIIRSGQGFDYIILKAGIDLFFLVWNVQSVVLFILFADKIESRIRPTRLNKYIKEYQGFEGQGQGTTVSKYENSSLSQIDAEREVAQLFQIMQDEKPYLDPDLTLQVLADRLNMKRNRLSQILNEYCGLKFYDFINNYRIDEVKQLMLKGKNPVNILQAAFDAGFNSKTTFYAAFKRTNGMSPSEFLSKVKLSDNHPQHSPLH